MPEPEPDTAQRKPKVRKILDADCPGAEVCRYLPAHQNFVRAWRPSHASACVVWPRSTPGSPITLLRTPRPRLRIHSRLAAHAQLGSGLISAEGAAHDEAQIAMQRPSHTAAAGFFVEQFCLVHGQKKLIPEMQFRAHVLGTHSVFVLACEDERFEDKADVPCPAEVLERIRIGMERQSEDVAGAGRRTSAKKYGDMGANSPSGARRVLRTPVPERSLGPGRDGLNVRFRCNNRGSSLW